MNTQISNTVNETPTPREVPKNWVNNAPDKPIKADASVLIIIKIRAMSIGLRNEAINIHLTNIKCLE